MFSKVKVTLIAAGLALSLGACEATTGEVLGGIGGAAIGAQFGGGTGKYVTTAAGAILGTVAGGYVERQMDDKKSSN